jgi:hypothetical protein
MRHGLLFALFVLLAPAAALGQDDNARAKTLAKELLDRGAALFDKRDAAAMAATYLETAEILVIKHDSGSDRMVVEAKHGRTEIEQAYAEIFKDRQPEHRCRNTVEAARFLSPDVLIIRGRFALNAAQGDALQFVQVRARDGEQWKVATMQLIELPK